MLDGGQIVAEYGPAVWRTVYRLLNHHADACDVYQEVFLAALEQGRREPVDSWPALLATLATRRAMDRLRQRYRLRSRFVSSGSAPEPATAAAYEPLGGLLAEELLGQTRIHLAGMPAKQAEVFWLSCVEERSHEAIGRQMGVSVGEVRVLLHRARSRLRDALSASHNGRER